MLDIKENFWKIFFAFCFYDIRYIVKTGVLERARHGFRSVAGIVLSIISAGLKARACELSIQGVLIHFFIFTAVGVWKATKDRHTDTRGWNGYCGTDRAILMQKMDCWANFILAWKLQEVYHSIDYECKVDTREAMMQIPA